MRGLRVGHAGAAEDVGRKGIPWWTDSPSVLRPRRAKRASKRETRAMKPIQRMNAVRAGQVVDRWPWVPSVYEHGARLLEKSPGEVSRSAALMAEAALCAYRTYAHDVVSVGIDIYNIEAEAFGCAISDGAGKSIPGVTSHPLGSGPLEPRQARHPGARARQPFGPDRRGGGARHRPDRCGGVGLRLHGRTVFAGGRAARVRAVDRRHVRGPGDGPRAVGPHGGRWPSSRLAACRTAGRV
jgi:hypothetical protein